MSGYFRPGVSKNQLETNTDSSQITVKPPDMPEASILTLYDNIEAEKHRHKQIRSCHSYLAAFFFFFLSNNHHPIRTGRPPLSVFN